jgi:hypothetical protein
MAKLSPLFNEAQFIDGVPAVGAKVFTYAAGSSTKLATYTTEDGDVAQANPIILNARGEPDSPIWLTEGQTYKFVFTSSTDTDPPTSPIRTIDDVTGVGDNSVTIDQWVESGVTPTFVSATQFTLPGDQTSTFQVNRRIKATVTAGTVYGYISASVFGALTTVTVVLDSGTLDSGLSAVQLGLITATNTSIPNTVFMKAGGTITGATTVTDDLTMSGASMIWSKGADVASAAALPLITDGNYFDVTGTTTITSMASMGVGTWIRLHLDGALTLTHNATDLILPGAANIVTAAGDEAEFIEYASGDWRCVSYTRNNALTNPLVQSAYNSLSGTSQDFTSIPSWAKRITISIVGMSTNGSSLPIIQIGDSGGVENTNYLGAAGTLTAGVTTAQNSSGFNLATTSTQASGAVYHGTVTLNLADTSTNTWTASGTLGLSSSAATVVIGGSKALSATLDRVRITMTNGTDTFDDGSWSIHYE